MAWRKKNISASTYSGNLAKDVLTASCQLTRVVLDLLIQITLRLQGHVHETLPELIPSLQNAILSHTQSSII